MHNQVGSYWVSSEPIIINYSFWTIIFIDQFHISHFNGNSKQNREYPNVIVHSLQIESKEGEIDETANGLLGKFELESSEETTFLFSSDTKFSLKGGKADSIVGRSVLIESVQKDPMIKKQVACGVVEECDQSCQMIFVL